MAFENVFGNVDFGQIARARQGEADRLQQAIGRGIAAGQQAQDRDTKKRQLEMVAAEKQAKANADVPALANAGYMALSAGATPTTLQMQAMEVVAAKQQPSGYVNPLGQAVVRQPVDPRTRLGQGMGQPTPEMAPQVAPQATSQAAPPMVTPDEFNASKALSPADQAAQDVVVTGRGSETPAAIKEEVQTKGALQEYLGKKEIDSVFEGVELNRVQKDSQGKYEGNLDRLLDGYFDLIEAGGEVVTLPDNPTLTDVIKNISSSAAGSEVGKRITGSIGTQGRAAINTIDSIRPVLFGNLRTLMGLTGKELDTKAERDFYLDALSNPTTDMETNAEIIESLSARYGSGESVEKARKLRNLVGGTKRAKKQTRESRLKRYQELVEKQGAK